MRVVSLKSPWKGHQPLYVFDFLIAVPNIWNNFKVLSRFMQNWTQSPACSLHGLHRMLSSYWLAHFHLMKKSAKCSSILVRVAEWWNFLPASRNPKNNWCLSRIFGIRFGEKDLGLSTYKPWTEQAGDWVEFCMKRLRTLKSFKIFKSEIKKSKTYSGWCPFQGLFNDTTLI